jgi:hypothetical protein
MLPQIETCMAILSTYDRLPQTQASTGQRSEAVALLFEDTVRILLPTLYKFLPMMQ